MISRNEMSWNGLSAVRFRDGSLALVLVGLAAYAIYPLFEVPADPGNRYWRPRNELTDLIPFLRGGVGARYLLSYLAVAVLGFTFLPNFLRRQTPSYFLRASAGLIIAYPMAHGLFRVMSLFVANDHLYLFGMLFLIATSVVGVLIGRGSIERPRFVWKSEIAWLIAFLVLFVSSLIVTLHEHGHTYTGHGESYYAWILHYLKSGAVSKSFPVFASHYDEILFNFWVYLSGEVGHRPVLSFWITNSVLKVGALSFLWLLFRSQGLNRAMATLASLFIFGASYQLNPWEIRFLTDNSTPLMTGLSPARYVWALLLVGLIVYLNRSEKLVMRDRVLAFLLILAVPAAPAHVLVAAIPMAIYFWLRPRLMFERQANGMAFGVLGFLCLLFALEWKGYGLYFLVPYIVMFLFFVFRSLRSFKGWRVNAWSGLLLGALLIPTLFFGNIASQSPTVQGWTYQLGIADPAERPIVAPFSHPFMAKPSVPLLGYHLDNPGLGPHRGVEVAFAYYGGLFVLWILALFHTRDTENGSKLRRPLEFAWFCFPMVIFLMYFVNDISAPAIKTRFLEFSIYIILFFSLVSLLRGKRTWLFSGVLSFHLVVSLLQKYPAFVGNAKVLWEMSVFAYK